MTTSGKILKLSCLAALFAGLATLALGVMLLVGNLVDTDACLTAVEGLLSTVFGVRCSILANVPSNTNKVKGKALILALFALATGAAFVFAGLSVTTAQLAAAAVICVIACVAFLVARSIVKEQLRK